MARNVAVLFRFPFIGEKGWERRNLFLESFTFMKICLIYGLFIIYSNRTKRERPISIRNYIRHCTQITIVPRGNALTSFSLLNLLFDVLGIMKMVIESLSLSL